MDTMRQTGGFLAPSHKQDRVFTHSSRLYSMGGPLPQASYPGQQSSGRRRSVGPPQYGRRPMDDYGHFGGGAGGGGQYYMNAPPPLPRNYGGGYQQQQQPMRQPQRYRRMPPARRRVYSQGNDYNYPGNNNRLKQMRQQQPIGQGMRRYVCDFCHVEFDSILARSRHTRRAHARNRRSTMNDGMGSASTDQTNKTQSAASQTSQAAGSSYRRVGEHRGNQQQDRKRKFVCQHCRAVFTSAKSITVHMKERHPNGTVELASPAADTPHPSVVPDDVKLHECAFCPFAFMTAGELARHRTRCRGSQQFSLDLKLVHPGNESFLVSCPLCRTMLNLAHGFKRHFDNVHPFAHVSVQYECALCQKLFDGSEQPVSSDPAPTQPVEVAAEEGVGTEEKKEDDPIHRAFEAVKAHITASHLDEELAQLKKHRASNFAEQSLKAYERFQRRQGNRRRRFSQRNRRSTNNGNSAAGTVQTNEVNTVMGDMLNELQSLDISDKPAQPTAAAAESTESSTPSGPATAPPPSQ